MKEYDIKTQLRYYYKKKALSSASLAKQIKDYIAFYKAHPPFIYQGDLYLTGYNVLSREDDPSQKEILPIYRNILAPQSFSKLLKEKFPFKILYMYSNLHDPNLPEPPEGASYAMPTPPRHDMEKTYHITIYIPKRTHREEYDGTIKF